MATFNPLLNPPVGRQACPQICPKPTTFWGASWPSWWVQTSFLIKWGAEQIFTVKPQQSSRSWGVGGQNLPPSWGWCKERPPNCLPCYVKAKVRFLGIFRYCRGPTALASVILQAQGSQDSLAGVGRRDVPVARMARPLLQGALEGNRGS